MQAIKNLVSGRTDEIQSGKEPVSGQTGAGTTSEPYDAGNTPGIVPLTYSHSIILNPSFMLTSVALLGSTSLGGSAPSESISGSSKTDVGSTLGGSTSGSGSTSTGGSENTFARDRGGPSPGNQGPHTISIANKLDPMVDSDGDGKPKSGATDIEHATVGGLSTTSGQQGSTGQYDTNVTGSSSTYDKTSNYGSNTSNTSGEIGGEAPSGEYSSSARDTSTSDYDNNTSSTIGNRSSTSTSDVFTNDPTSAQQTSSSTTAGSEPYSSTTGGTSSSNHGGQEDLSRSTGVNVTGGIRPEHQTDKTGVTSMHSNDPKFSDQPLTSSNQSSVADRGQDRGPVGGFGSVEPSVGADVSSGNTLKQKEPGGDRPLEEPTGDQADAVKGEKETTERQQAGESSAGGQHPGQAGGKTSEGTGEQWVKTSGVAADGGDFDAAKPGAGREADRLLEQQGIHREPGHGKADTDTSDSAGKPSMGQKIKEKILLG